MEQTENIDRAITQATSLSITGWIITIASGITLIPVIIFSPPSILIGCLIAFFAGLIMINSGSETKKRINLFKKYVSLLSADPSHSLSQLASSTGQSVDKVIQNVDLMIKKQYFTNAYVDQNNDRIVFVQYTPSQSTTPSFRASKPEYVVVTCKNCGAVSSIVKGSAAKCEYCGSKLS